MINKLNICINIHILLRDELMIWLSSVSVLFCGFSPCLLAMSLLYLYAWVQIIG